MAIDSYDNLKTAVENWLDRDDLTDQIDDFIDIAEARHQREVRIRQMLVRQPIGVVSRFVSLPNDYLDAKTFRLLDDGTDRLIFLVNLNQSDFDRERREFEGQPAYYTVDNEIELDRPPHKTYNGEIKYYKALQALASNNQTNKLLERAPDIYLYSSLVASAPFLQDDARITTWDTLYVDAKNAINRLDSKTIGVPVATVPGHTP